MHANITDNHESGIYKYAFIKLYINTVNISYLEFIPVLLLSVTL